MQRVSGAAGVHCRWELNPTSLPTGRGSHVTCVAFDLVVPLAIQAPGAVWAYAIAHTLLLGVGVGAGALAMKWWQSRSMREGMCQ